MGGLRLGLKPRLYGGFGIIVLIGLALAIFATWELSGIKDQVFRFGTITDNTGRSLEVARRIETIRRSNLRYTVDADEKAMEEAAGAESTAIDLLKASAAATLAEERRRVYDGFRAEIESLRTKRNALMSRSEERRVGKECRSRWSPY